MFFCLFIVVQEAVLLKVVYSEKFHSKTRILLEHKNQGQTMEKNEAKGKRVLSIRYKQHTPLLSQPIYIGTVRDTHDEAQATLHCHAMVTVNNIGKQFHIAESSVNLCVRYKQHTPLRQIMDQDHAAFDMLNFKTETKRCSVFYIVLCETRNIETLYL